MAIPYRFAVAEVRGTLSAVVGESGNSVGRNQLPEGIREMRFNRIHASQDDDRGAAQVEVGRGFR
jgi:hypothetical protein